MSKSHWNDVMAISMVYRVSVKDNKQATLSVGQLIDMKRVLNIFSLHPQAKSCLCKSSCTKILNPKQWACYCELLMSSSLHCSKIDKHNWLLIHHYHFRIHLRTSPPDQNIHIFTNSTHIDTISPPYYSYSRWLSLQHVIYDSISMDTLTNWWGPTYIPLDTSLPHLLFLFYYITNDTVV